MRLGQAATYFDKEIFTGVVETNITFKGQLRVFTDETSSGSSRGRRVLSIGPDITIPTDYLIEHTDGAQYIIGKHSEEDYWNNSTIRRKYTVSEVTDTASSGTVENALSDSFATTLYSIIYPLSTFSERIDASDKYHRVRIYFSASVQISRDTVVKSGTTYFQTITNTLIDPAGFSFVDANVLENPRITADYISIGTDYNAASDSYTPAVATGVTIFKVPAITDYDYEGLDAEKIKSGDLMISVLKSEVAAVKSGDTFDIGIITYSVVHIIDHTTYWSLLCRK